VDVHEYMLALKECLLAELKPADRTSVVTASGEGYDENLHSLMQTILGYVWLRTNPAKRYMHNMQLRYYKGRTIQQTPGAISRITS
jgi:hypothetical protein